MRGIANRKKRLTRKERQSIWKGPTNTGWADRDTMDKISQERKDANGGKSVRGFLYLIDKGRSSNYVAENPRMIKR